MKNLITWKSITVALGLAVLLAAPAVAQTSTVRVDIPFAFTAGNQVFPAGEYQFGVDTGRMYSRITPTNGTTVGLVRLVPGVSERSVDDVDKGMLRFEKQGQRYLLVGIWRAGSITGNGVVNPRRPASESAEAASVRDLAATR